MAQLDHEEKQGRVVCLVHKERRVNLVHLGRAAQVVQPECKAVKVYKDSEGQLVHPDLLDQVDLLDQLVQLEKQDLRATEVNKVLLAPLENQGQQGQLETKGREEPLDPEVKLVLLGQKGLLGLLDELVKQDPAEKSEIACLDHQVQLGQEDPLDQLDLQDPLEKLDLKDNEEKRDCKVALGHQVLLEVLEDLDLRA